MCKLGKVKPKTPLKMFIKSLENTCVHTKKTCLIFFLIQRIIYIYTYMTNTIIVICVVKTVMDWQQYLCINDCSCVPGMEHFMRLCWTQPLGAEEFHRITPLRFQRVLLKVAKIDKSIAPLPLQFDPHGRVLCVQSLPPCCWCWNLRIDFGATARALARAWAGVGWLGEGRAAIERCTGGGWSSIWR